jgi:hypothetical protein
LMPSTPLAYPQVDRGCFVSFRVVESSIPQFTPFFAPGSIPGSSTTKMWQQFLRPRDDHQKVPQKPGRAQIYSDGVVESDDDRSPIPHIYTLREAANALRVPGEWLRTRLANGTFAGLRRGSRWAMTEQQILAVIESMTVPAREPESYPGGLSRRSWLYHQRRREKSTSPRTPCGARAKSSACPHLVSHGSCRAPRSRRSHARVDPEAARAVGAVEA